MDSKRSLFGILSLMLPAPVVVLWVVMELNPQLGNGMNGYAGMLIAGFLFVATFAFCGLGLVLAITSLLRREQNKYLPILDIIVNVIVGFWMLMHA